MQRDLEIRIARAAEVLRQYGATAVFLFGSAATDDSIDPQDVDMAVEGLPAEIYFRAWSRAAHCLDRELDLVRLETDSPFTRYLRDKGKLKRVR